MTNINRRQFIGLASSTGIGLATHHLLTAAGAEDRSQSSLSIDRHALVTRHNPVIRSVDPILALTVGNGEFGFTADITGLQSFPEAYKGGIPLGILSHWGWHRFPNPNGYSVETFPLTYMKTQDRMVGYLYSTGDFRRTNLQGSEKIAQFLYTNPHRLGLGRIGLEMTKADNSLVESRDIKNIEQKLDLWTGILYSQFEVEGQPVRVETCVQPEHDAVALRIESQLLASGSLKVLIAFPYASYARTGEPDYQDWNQPDAHKTMLSYHGKNRAHFHRQVDAEEYYVKLAWSPEGSVEQAGKHRYIVSGRQGCAHLDVVAWFSAKPVSKEPDSVDEIQASCRKHWEHFWNTGGAIDLSGNEDPRAHELERRIVLSQYLTAIHSAGSLPPQESGLAHNSWAGRFHLEMHWWHAAHFPLWGREWLLERSMPFYQRILPKARATAVRQGYRGAKWPKCVGPDGVNGPASIEPYLVWQQMHPLYFAELCFRAHPDNKTLERYKDIVLETAEFMASYVDWDDKKQCYVLGPPIAEVAEVYNNYSQNMNPPMELAEWRFGLETAQRWREQLGMGRNEEWDHIIRHLSTLPEKDGLYVGMETFPDAFTPQYSRSHPGMVAPLGMLNTETVDRQTMRRTLHRVVKWTHFWGWDYPLMAMTAARLGETDLAVDLLVRNSYSVSGNCIQRKTLPVYMPANGGLLAAVAMMAAGWDGGPKTQSPGFPSAWKVRYEGLRPMP